MEPVNQINSPPTSEAAPPSVVETTTVAAELTAGFEEQTVTVDESMPETFQAVDPELEFVTETTESQIYNGVPIYSVFGSVLDEGVQAFLYNELSKYGLEWFMPYAVLIAYQESRFDFYAVNQHNGLDMGLFQYRITYYPGSNIFDPYEQCVIFCRQTANRASSGCQLMELISRHNTSDYSPYNQQYVNEVMQHEPGLARIK